MNLLFFYVNFTTSFLRKNKEKKEPETKKYYIIMLSI